MRIAINLADRVFGKLKVRERAGQYVHNTNKKRYREAMWLCDCLCGAEKIIRSTRLTSGQAKSCGCLKRDLAATYGPRMSQFKKKPGTAARNVFRSYKHKAVSRGLIFEITFEQFLEISQKPCGYCGVVQSNCKVSSSGEVFKYNGIDRRDNLIGYLLTNCTPCCGWCNMAKFKSTLEDFILHCKLVASYN